MSDLTLLCCTLFGHRWKPTWAKAEGRYSLYQCGRCGLYQTFPFLPPAPWPKPTLPPPTPMDSLPNCGAPLGRKEAI
jgi:hypothetical protein